MEIKKCGRCKIVKQISEFSFNKATKDGYDYTCKECLNKAKRERRKGLIATWEYTKVESLEGEVWKDIEGFEGKYQVSNLGRVKSLNYNHTKKEKTIKGIVNSRGYVHIGLMKDKKNKTFNVHVLVAKAFIPNPNNYPIINHKDEIKTNNKAENLEWCTQKYNVNYGTRIERIQKTRGKKVYQYSLERIFIKKWDSIAECGRNGFDSTSVSERCRGLKKNNIFKGYIWSYTPLK